MKYIKLTTPEGGINYVNMGLVSMFCSNRNTGGTVLHFDGELYEIVSETPEEILELLNAK